MPLINKDRLMSYGYNQFPPANNKYSPLEVGGYVGQPCATGYTRQGTAPMYPAQVNAYPGAQFGGYQPPQPMGYPSSPQMGYPQGPQLGYGAPGFGAPGYGQPSPYGPQPGMGGFQQGPYAGVIPLLENNRDGIFISQKFDLLEAMT